MGRTVLVADHNLDRAKQLASALTALGWRVLAARDAVSATAMVMRERPEAMVLSQRLPGGGALVTLRRARASVHTAAVPAIALVDEQGADAKALLREGARECLDVRADAATVVGSLQKCFAEPERVMEAPDSILRNPDRLASLDRTGLLDSPATQPFDTLTRVAAALLSVPVAVVSLVDRDRQFFKSSFGVPEPWASRRETPLSHSFCQWVVSDHAALVTADAREHPVLRNNLALHELGVVAYAGIPLATNSGEAIGSFCAIDSKVHRWTDVETDLLRQLTSVAEALVALAELEGRWNQPSSDEVDRAFESLTTAAVGRGISSVSGLLRREQLPLSESDRHELLSLLHWLGQQLVRITERVPAMSAR